MSFVRKYLAHSTFDSYESLMAHLREHHGCDVTVHGTSVNDGQREYGKCYGEDAGGYRYVPYVA